MYCRTKQALGILPGILWLKTSSSKNQVKFILQEFRSVLLGFIDWKRAYGYVERVVRDFEIKCSSPKQRVKELSGGNQQKVCIARALTVNPQLLFVAEPTRGIDIAAKEKILKMLIDINRSKGTTIVIASSELDELKRVCDRIAVLVNGSIFKILYPDSPDLEFGLALAGEEGVNHEGLQQHEELHKGLHEELCG